MTDEPTTIIFGAFDRHNFGDLLFAHIVARMSGCEDAVFAGVAGRDLTRYGGHRVRALTDLAQNLGGRAVNLIHAGGEILTCGAWEAAAMTLAGDAWRRTVAHLDKRPMERTAWTQSVLHTRALAPYVASRELFPQAAWVSFNAAGGVELDTVDAALRAEVLLKLAAADDVSVRDAHTQTLLAAAGVNARLIPDPAVMVAQLEGARIDERAQRGELARTLDAFPNGYIAVQFSADFGDDATLARIAAQLERVAQASGHGIVFFRAGAAPWHDDAACYERTAARMRMKAAAIFGSLDVWDICALIARSRGFVGSSLHGRIVATAFALPRVSVRHPSSGAHVTKQAAFASTWDDADTTASVEIDDIACATIDALATDPARRARKARELEAAYREGFEPVARRLSRGAPAPLIRR
ncbi:MULTISPECIES: polysaccharide pyruvyl transferase family protein [unclassified Caballeronia]|uniref:polysaccharide pyruvyl transferase family protein n=1 Tax=unclassified Caballeronia TaxID=2646786 RepID=UPI00285DA110|nr:MULTISPECIES: polysaccharide pyruvyl transferase family protein [unclassified Caballeronia]MDR5753347.1 polysaccharide pyruvyl transferase family protein [Caballeronia sp. LZ024]MDR5841086.1 polysaccharide pyruvyl transferase family protein [Caballeronia sp. LZ031]